MFSLAELPEVIGFFSYSRDDDEAFQGTLSALRDAIQRELGAQLGRNRKNFRLWQDHEAIAPGTLWESEIKNAVAESVFFIPIITPRVVTSQYCRFEFESFPSREKELGRADLVFPMLYISVRSLDDAAKRANDRVLSMIAERQYVDWRPYRYLDIQSPGVRQAIGEFSAQIVSALSRPWLSPAERSVEEGERQRQAEVERVAEERSRLAAAKQRSDEVAQSAAADARRQEEERKAAATAFASQNAAPSTPGGGGIVIAPSVATIDQPAVIPSPKWKLVHRFYGLIKLVMIVSGVLAIAPFLGLLSLRTPAFIVLVISWALYIFMSLIIGWAWRPRRKT